MYVVVRLGRDELYNFPNEVAVIGVYYTESEAQRAMLANAAHVFAELDSNEEFQSEGERRLSMTREHDRADLCYGEKYNYDYIKTWLIVEDEGGDVKTDAFGRGYPYK